MTQAEKTQNSAPDTAQDAFAQTGMTSICVDKPAKSRRNDLIAVFNDCPSCLVNDMIIGLAF